HLFVPAAANLTGHGQRRTARHGANDVLHEIEILEAAGTAVPLDDLLDRAAEVDVDEFGREDVGDERGRLTHRDGIGAENLNGDGTLVGTEAQLTDGRFVFASDSLRRQELRHDDVGAEATAEPPEGRFRYPGHGREVKRDVRVKRKRKAFHSFKLREGRSASN